MGLEFDEVRELGDELWALADRYAGDEAADEAALHAKQNIYFQVILYSTFGLAAVRFAGVSVYYRPVGSHTYTVSSACGTSSSAICSAAAAGTKQHELFMMLFILYPLLLILGYLALGH